MTRRDFAKLFGIPALLPLAEEPQAVEHNGRCMLIFKFKNNLDREQTKHMHEVVESMLRRKDCSDVPFFIVGPNCDVSAIRVGKAQS